MQPHRPTLDEEGGSLRLDACASSRPYNKTLKRTLAGKARTGELYIGQCVVPAGHVKTIKDIVGETHTVENTTSC
jgi:hypothetical protein